MLYSVEIGVNIVKIRKELGMSQEELAFRAGISISRLRDIEHGRANSSIDTLESIAKALEVELPVLFLYSLDEGAIMQMLQQPRKILAAAR